MNKNNYSQYGWKCPACNEVVTLSSTDEAPHYGYKCPHCGKVSGANEWELDANALITEFKKVQRGGFFPCPRCGQYKMDTDSIRNAFSRYANIQICNDCGTDEAMRDFSGNCLSMENWEIFKKPEVFVKSI